MISVFEFTKRVFVASFRILGYCVVFIVQIIYYLVVAPRHLDKIGNAFGYFGQGVVNTVADIFNK